MYKIVAILLFIGSLSMSYDQSTDTLIVDESFYDNGNIKHQRFYKDGKANGKWTHYYKNGNFGLRVIIKMVSK